MYFQCLFLLMHSTEGRSVSGMSFPGDTSLVAALFAFFFFFLFFRSVSRVGDGSMDEIVGDDVEKSSWTG